MSKPINARRASGQAPGPRRLTGCREKTRAGKPCTAPPIQGTSRCAFHTKGRASAAGKVGGPRRKIFDPTKLTPFVPPESAQELSKILAGLMVEVHSAKLDSKTSNALSVLGSTFLQSLQHGEMEERLAKLEASMKTSRDTRR